MFRSRCSSVLIIMCLLAIVLCDASPGLSQPMWLDHDSDKVIAWEFLKPNFVQDNEYSFFTSANFLSCRFRSKKTALVGEIPFAHYGGGSSDNALGNPYVGIEQWSGENVFFEFGVRLPLAPSDKSATVIGGITDFVDRLEAFAVDAFPISATVNYFYKNPAGAGLRLRGGPSFLMATGGRDGSEWFVLYGAQMGYWGSVLNFSGGFSGRFWLAEDSGGNSDRAFHQLVLAVGLTPGMVHPSVNIRVPLGGDLSSTLDWVVGINLSFNLR